MNPEAISHPIRARIAISSAATREEAHRIAHALLEARIAACVNIVEHIHSIYRWQEEVEEADEVMLFIKTTEDHLIAVEETLKTLHSYQLPEFVVLPVVGGSLAYLQWLTTSVR
ncbi:MAG TPA: divalent-cation tolerance protein CutA [Acidisarcina sp.]|nr:divalent-cation tolerance protein CutA [Acidisarcina sp.]